MFFPCSKGYPDLDTSQEKRNMKQSVCVCIKLKVKTINMMVLYYKNTLFYNYLAVQNYSKQVYTGCKTSYSPISVQIIHLFPR